MPGFGLTSLAFPLMILIPVLKERGPAARFFNAGAISPETARKPSTVSAKGDLSGVIKIGVLVDVGDGRYYVDAERYRQRRSRQVVTLCVLGVILSALSAFIIWRTW